MSFTFAKATKKQSRLRMDIEGPPGSGKTFTALKIATGLLSPGGKIALIDTERGSASKYSWDPDLYPPGTPIPEGRFVFDVLELDNFAPSKYVEAMILADSMGYEVTVVDSLSHAWNAKGGALEMADKIAKRSSSGNSFNAWKDVTPEQNKMVDTILQSRSHVIVTMRVKTDYVIEKDERTGKSAPKKVGLAAVQREGMDYEFDVVGRMDHTHSMLVTKTRCSAISDAFIEHPGVELAMVLKDWLTDGVNAPEPMRMPTPEVKDESDKGNAEGTRNPRLDNPKLKELFDFLGAPEAKRLAAMQKYKADSKLIEVLEGKVAEEKAARAKTAAKALALPPPAETTSPVAAAVSAAADAPAPAPAPAPEGAAS